MNSIINFFREPKIGRFFIPFGIMCIIFSIVMFMIDNNHKNYIKTDAIITKTELVEAAHTDIDGNYVDATYNVYVKYTVNNKEYEELLGEMSNYKKGDKIKIVYNPDNPKEISSPPSIIITLAIFLVGIFTLVSGILTVITRTKKSNNEKI